MNSIGQLSRRCFGKVVLIAAPGPSMETIHSLRKGDYDLVMGVNLAVERVPCDLWCVVDSPLRIRDQKKRERFVAVDPSMTLIAPSTSLAGWADRDPYFFTPFDPFVFGFNSIGSVNPNLPKDPPRLPCFAGAPYAAAAAAFYMGARKVILSGVDYHGTIHATKDQILRIQKSWDFMRRWCEANKRLLEQANPASLVTFTPASSL